MNARALKRLAVANPNDPYSITGTFQVTGEIYHERLLLLDAAGGFTVTLPKAAGSGSVMQFMVQAVSTTGYVIKTASSSDVYTGSLQLGVSAGGAGGSEQFVSSANKTLTLNGTTTGGAAIGDTFWLCDYASGFWGIWGNLIGSGTLATPFSN